MPPEEIISGLRDTNNITQEQRVVDMSDRIAQLQPDETPLTVILKMLRKKVAYSPKFEWLEDDLQARWDSVKNLAGYDDAATEIKVKNPAYFSVRDVVKVPRTGEVMYVTAVNTGTGVITVTRGYGTTSAAALNDSDYLLVLGNANQQGADAPAMKTTNTKPMFNYTQIFRTTVGVTGTQMKSKLYGGADLAYQRSKKGREHKVDIERMFIFGEKKEDLTGEHPLYTTGGVLSFLSTNVMDVGGTLTAAKLEEFCEMIFQYGSDTKLFLCSSKILSAISAIARERLQVVPKDQTFGINVRQYISPHGVLNLVKHPLFVNAYNGSGLVLDANNLWYRHLDGRDTTLRLNIQDKKADAEEDEYLTEAGLQMELEQTHGYMEGVA